MNRRGYSLLEVCITCALFSLMAVLGFLSMRQSGKVLAISSGRDKATAQLMKARHTLVRDLEMASPLPSCMRISPSPASLGGGADGDGLLFLSAVDPATGAFQCDAGQASPFWMRNVLYYLTVPNNYASTLGYSMSGGSVAGYDFSIPVKQLVRVVSDENAGNNPAVASTEDTLLASATALMTRPATVFSSPDRQTVANGLLGFRCNLVGSALQVDLWAVSFEEAARAQGFNPALSYREGRYTVQHRFLVYPKN